VNNRQGAAMSVNISEVTANPFKTPPHKRNGLKIRALEAFEQYGTIDPIRLAAIVGYFPARAVYTYCLRLHRFGLLHRLLSADGLIFYKISRRGRERLAYLRDERAKKRDGNLDQ